VDGLVTNNQFLKVLGLVPRHRDVHIGDIKLILILQEEIRVIRIVFIESDDEKT
jgi:hypothetical protein